MIINWPLVTVLFCLSVPGVIIAIKRLIYFLLPNNTKELKQRISRFAILQTLVMVFILCLAGTVLSRSTGLRAPVLEAMLNGTAEISTFYPMLLPVLGYTLLGLIIFLTFYYGVASKLLDKKNREIINALRITLGVDGCVLYGGVVEEIIARWGLMNLTTFFAIIFVKHPSNMIIWISILISGLIFAVGQLPGYLAAGCTSTRNFIYSSIMLSMCQSVLFGYLFWQYGLVCSILSHMLFHLGWALYDLKFGASSHTAT